MSEQKVSLLINRQVPEFVRDEYPTFIRFLEAYYEFLENKQTGKNNDLNVVEPYKNKDKFKYEFRDNDFNYFDKNLEN